MKFEKIVISEISSEFVKEYLAVHFEYTMFVENEEEKEYRECVMSAYAAYIKQSGEMN